MRSIVKLSNLFAVREDIHICGVGVVILLVIPIVYVQLDTEQLVSVNPARRLHVFCAGVWHNTVLAAAAVALYWSLPWLLSPFYISGEGVYIQSVQTVSIVSRSIPHVTSLLFQSPISQSPFMKSERDVRNAGGDTVVSTLRYEF